MKTGLLAVVTLAALAGAGAAGSAEPGKAYAITLKTDACAAMAATVMVALPAASAADGETTPFDGQLTEDATCGGRTVLPRGSRIVGTTLFHQENIRADGTDTGEPETAWLDVTFQRAVRPDGSEIAVAGALRRTVNLRL